MRLLKLDSHGDLSLTKDFGDDAPPYAVLSHTWNEDNEKEVTFSDVENKAATRKPGYAKLQFCGEQAKEDGLEHFWVDTCCINKANHAELSEAITSMFRWYRDAVKCYVYLSDVSARKRNHNGQAKGNWEVDFRTSRWFTRGWTLQKLLAPASVEFFSCEGDHLGDKISLERQIHAITHIPIAALSGTSLSDFSVDERKRWAVNRETKKKEDKAYCLLGIFNVFIPLIYGEGDHAITRLEEEIEKRSRGKSTTIVVPETGLASSSSSALPTHVHWMVPRHANPLFTGREDLLQELHSIVSDAMENSTKNCSNQTHCRIVLSGMGGQGKSEICLQLAHRLRHIFWGVFWVDVSTTGTAERSFLDVAQKLSIPVQSWNDARLGLANLKHPWLLVLDNADDPNVDYQDYFPDGILGVVMLTSRNHECQQHATVKSIALEGLSDKEAQELLLKAARVSLDQPGVQTEDVVKVASLLQSHPLALIQAGAYISRGHCSLAEYPMIFTQRRQRLLEFRPAQGRSRYRDVYATFEASADVLQLSQTQAAADALQLLPVLAICGPSRLPLPLFEAAWKGAQSVSPSIVNDDADMIKLTSWHVSHLPPLVQADTDSWDSYRLIDAVNLLKAFSLVLTDNLGGFLSVSMHPLTHAWARDRQAATEQHDSWVITGCLVAISRDDEAFWRRSGGQLQPHLQVLTSWEFGKMFASEVPTRITSVLVNCGWLLHDLRDDAILFVLIQKLLIRLGLSRSTVDQRWLNVYELAGRNLVDYGKSTEAVSLLEQLVQIVGQTLANDAPDRLNLQRELARAYQANGQVQQAVSLLEQVIMSQEGTLSEASPDQLNAYRELAGAYKENGQVTQAVSMLQQVVTIQEQTESEDSPDRLRSQFELAGAFEANGQIKEAVLLLEQVVKIGEQALRENHPDQLMSQHALARAYEANGQVKEAVLLLEQVVKIREQTHREDHPDRLASQHALAMAYYTSRQVKEAVLLLEQVVNIQQQTLREDHPDRLASQHALAMAYHKSRQMKEAVLLLEQVVKIRKQTLREDHPDRLASQHELARAYLANKQVKKAVVLLEQVVTTEEQTLREDHPDRLASQHVLAVAYQKNGQVTEAASLLEQVMKIQEQTHGEDYPDRLLLQHNLATMYWNLGRRNASLRIMKHVVEKHRQMLDEHHPDRGVSEAWLELIEDKMRNLELT